MSKLWLIGLAASAAWAPAAIAQHAPPAPPPPPPPMAHGAHAPAPMMHPGMHRPMPMPGGGMKGFHRFGRGHIVPPHFRGGQFIVHDWRTFGWPAPMPGGHWIRFHDDALLIDGDGRVIDGRYAWDWDRRGDSMAHHEDDRWDGADVYDEDYDRDGWDEEDGRRHHGKGEHRGKRDRMVRVYRHGDGYEGGDCRRSCTRVRHLPPPPPHPGYGYGYGYGYGGYGYGCGCGPVVVTETITTTAPVVEKQVYYETVYERAAPRRHYSKPVVRHGKPVVRHSKPVVRRSVKAAPPRPGERG